ncbi:MAG: hypothetical protein MUF61_00235 [archaeon]|jgi:hypothetical protein|nr:hypothetical protein [archaeon]
MPKITRSSQLKERSTGYNFIRFWQDFTERDEVWQEEDGGSFLKWGVRRDLRGLCSVCTHYLYTRGNPTGEVTVRQIVDHVSKYDPLFAKRVKGQYESLPDITVKEWIDRVVHKEDKKLREMLGLTD